MNTHAQKPDFVFRAKRTSPIKSAGVASVQSTAGSRGVRISGSNAGFCAGGVSSVDYCASAVVMLDSAQGASVQSTTAHQR